MIGAWGIAFLAVIGVLLPVLAFRTSALLGEGPLPLPRRFFYLQTLVLQAILLLLAMLTAWREAVPVRWPPAEPVRGLLAAVALLAAALMLLVLPAPRSMVDARERLCRLLPEDRRDIPPYLLLCGVAGIAEEVVYRGVAVALLMRVLPNTAAAILVTALLFALGHALQGFPSVVVIFLFALGFHLLVIVSGSLLYPAIVHFLYDAVAGVLLPKLVQRERAARRREGNGAGSVS